MALGELAVSSLLAPAVMVRQSVDVAAVLAGRDCGWKPAGGCRRDDGMPWLEPAAGLALVVAVLPGPGDVLQLALVLPIALPLLAAPLLMRWLEQKPVPRPHWEDDAATLPQAA
jgi:membrane glycosyltransferase